MELSRKDIIRYRQILLETFKAFSALCDENGLEWYMAFGSAIGTVRHKGFIPWDDDIDVFMPRPDYERFLRLQVHGYRIVGPRQGGDWPFPYSKFCDASTTLWERQLYPCLTGVFIDVFPLDEAPADSERIKKRYRRDFLRYKRSQRLHQPGEIREKLRRGDFRGAVKVLLDDMWHAGRGDVYRGRWLEDEKMASEGRGDSYVVYGTNDDYWGMTMPKSWFGETLVMPFEDTVAKMPCGYDEMLRMFYGDYMQLPPETKQVSNHYHYFVDLGRALTIDQVVDILP